MIYIWTYLLCISEAQVPGIVDLVILCSNFRGAVHALQA